MARDDAYYAQLIRELLSNVGYVSGRRRFPRTLTAWDAVRITGRMHAELDQGCVERERAATARRLKIACAAGCHYCCVQPVTVFLPEAIRIAEWLTLPRNAEMLAAFRAAYPAWKQAVGDGFEPILDAAAREDMPELRRAHLCQQARGILCAFNRDGLCGVYEVRPAACREHIALDTSEQCQLQNRTGREEDAPAGIAFAPVESALVQSRLMARAMHHALGGDRLRPKALCQAVWDVLESDEEKWKAVAPAPET